MKTGLTKKQKVTEFYFNEHDDLAEIYTHNADLKKRLLAYAKEYPELCQLTAPYSPERKKSASQYAKQFGIGTKYLLDDQ